MVIDVCPDSGLRICQMSDALAGLMIIERAANLIIHKLLVWIIFLQQTKELDNVGILFVTVTVNLRFRESLKK